jgi:hypothetical protein
MGSDLVRRVRWRNVARAGAVVAVVATVVAWPRLTPPPPRLPDRAPRPLVTPSVQEHDEVREAAPDVPEVRRAPRRRGQHRNEGARRRVRRRPARPKRVARRRVNPGVEGGGVAGPGVGGGTVGTVEGGGTVGDVTPGGGAPPPAPAQDPAETEFGFER